MKLQAMSEKLNKIHVDDLKWQHHDYFFKFIQEFMRGTYIIVKTFGRIMYFVYMAIYMMCVFIRYLVIMTRRSNLS